MAARKWTQWTFTGCLLFLILFGFYFSYDLITLKKYLAHPEYVTYYPSFRHWFHQNLLHGKFPQWNPYWGLGHSTEIHTTFPVDIFSPLEILWGPRYAFFQLFQCCAILLACLWSFKRLGISPAFALLGALVFFMSPWVNYFFFYYLKPPTFLTLILGVPVLVSWFHTRSYRSLYFFTAILILGFFGMKLEYLFFMVIFFFVFGTGLYWVHRSTEASYPSRSLWACYLGVLFALLCHCWQWIPLLQVLNVTNRLENPLGLAAFGSRELYEKLLLSISTSEFIKLCLITLIGLETLRKFTKAKALLFLSALLILRIIHLGYWSYFLSPFGMGCLFAALYMGKTLRPSLKDFCSTLLLFLPIAYYWCRPEPGDVRELSILHSAPWGLAFSLGLLYFFGAEAVRTQPLAKIGFGLLLFLFFMRDQGQILLSFIAGVMWIPTRDNFLFDFLLTLLGLLGLSALPLKRPLVLASLLIGMVLLSISKNPYYSHPLIREMPADLPYTLGVPKYQQLFAELEEPHSLFRGYLFDLPEAIHLPQFGTSLLTKHNTVHMMSSLLPKRYRDWVIYQRYGFLPGEKWAGYENEYTEETIRKLPRRDSKGFENTLLYWNTLHAFPPPNPNALRILGVTHLYYEGPPMVLPELSHYQRVGSFQTARLNETLPRAFLIPFGSADIQLAFSSDLNPHIAKGVIVGKHYQLPYQAVPILNYTEERVDLTVDASVSSVLVLGDLFHPFWHARVDGKEVNITPALYLFRGVPIREGSHQVEFYCAIPYLKWGFWISLTLLGCFALLPFFYKRGFSLVRIPILVST